MTDAEQTEFMAEMAKLLRESAARQHRAGYDYSAMRTELAADKWERAALNQNESPDE